MMLTGKCFSSHKDEMSSSDSETLKRCQTLSPETSCEYLTYLILVSIKFLGNRTPTPSVVNIYEKIIIISIYKSLKSCWGDHVDPPKTTIFLAV